MSILQKYVHTVLYPFSFQKVCGKTVHVFTFSGNVFTFQRKREKDHCWSLVCSKVKLINNIREPTKNVANQQQQQEKKEAGGDRKGWKENLRGSTFVLERNFTRDLRSHTRQDSRNNGCSLREHVPLSGEWTFSAGGRCHWGGEGKERLYYGGLSFPVFSEEINADVVRSARGGEAPLRSGWSQQPFLLLSSLVWWQGGWQ